MSVKVTQQVLQRHGFEILWENSVNRCLSKEFSKSSMFFTFDMNGNVKYAGMNDGDGVLFPIRADANVGDVVSALKIFSPKTT